MKTELIKKVLSESQKVQTMKYHRQTFKYWLKRTENSVWLPIEYDHELENKMVDIVQHGDVLHLSELK